MENNTIIESWINSSDNDFLTIELKVNVCCIGYLGEAAIC